MRDAARQRGGFAAALLLSLIGRPFRHRYRRTGNG